ncbi:MAG TPA: DUF1800 domain-containing protein [Oculatellaceae cyanobacterium]
MSLNISRKKLGHASRRLLAAVIACLPSIPAVATPTSSSVASSTASAASASSSSTSRILHLLNRTSFGPKPGDIEAVRAEGIDGYLQQQLHPESIREADSVSSFIHSSDAFRLSAPQLFQDYGPFAENDAKKSAMQTTIVYDRRQRPKGRRSVQDSLVRDLMEAKLLRAVESPRQLQEVMADFWFNHFNICYTKGLDKIWTAAYEEQAIRPYALGKFRDLVYATCHHPAMLYYLDNWQNSAPGAKGAKGAQSGLNENYARELMELHTLGVDGGYTQKDVTELARILTGLGIGKQDAKGMERGTGNGCIFDSSRHDFGTKTLLGHTIRGTGESEIDEALAILLRHPSTARHLSFQLAQYFVADKPPASLVGKMAATWTQTDGDIKSVLTTMFKSPEFWNETYNDGKFKSPIRYVVSTLRAADAKPGKYYFATEFLKGQGMPLYSCLTPDGYKNTREAWVNPDTLLKRITFATTIASGGIPEASPYAIEYRRLGATLGNQFSAQTVKTIMKAPDILRSALILGSPEFMKY